MYNFFVDENAVTKDGFIISGGDFNHIKNVLRMKEGDNLLVSVGGASHLCTIVQFDGDFVKLKTVMENYNDTALPIKIYLFQGMPKSDKLETVIQKAVELGVSTVVPVEMARSIVKIEEKKKKSKQERWQAIAESAAKQSKRNLVPDVYGATSFNKALEVIKELDLLLVPYECKNGMQDTKDALACINKGMKVGVFIGPEGGFEESEIAKLSDEGGKVISLGKRILRTETAAICALSMLMLHAEINLSE
jgi:16S rRNA (uracil1498-N3)-methyltransferase